MERIRQLNFYQKSILIFMLAVLVIFAWIYARTIARVGWEYDDVIFVPTQDAEGGTVYSGKLSGQPASFTVSADRTAVVFQYGSQTYGPYVAAEDPSAIPQEDNRDGQMYGVELRLGDALLFRGGVLPFRDTCILYSEDGHPAYADLSYSTSGDDSRDSVQPSPEAILTLMHGPRLTHHGSWGTWFACAVLCVGNALLILFADEIFRWNLAFQIRNADRAEPSDWELGTRYLNWAVLALSALVALIAGLH